MHTYIRTYIAIYWIYLSPKKIRVVKLISISGWDNLFLKYVVDWICWHFVNICRFSGAQSYFTFSSGNAAVFDKQKHYQNTALHLSNFPNFLLNAKENRFISIKDGMYISTNTLKINHVSCR